VIKGLQPVSFVDWPGRISTVLFTDGCNLDCAWCHNRALVEPDQFGKMPEISEGEIRSLLSERKNFIDGVCLTGGEPLLQGSRLRAFVRALRNETGLPFKIDTNGLLPDELSLWYDEGLVDFTAMDIKNSFDKYPRTTGMASVDCSLLERSIGLIRTRSPGWQFRITLVPGLVEDSDIRWIEDRFGVNLTVQEYREVRNS
jgi:pyruvate formate lyase activating enzyme